MSHGLLGIPLDPAKGRRGAEWTEPEPVCAGTLATSRTGGGDMVGLNCVAVGGIVTAMITAAGAGAKSRGILA